jgi:hypothetical protein
MSQTAIAESTDSGPNSERARFRFPIGWSINRLLVLALAGGFLGVVMDVRLEHVTVVREHWIGWTPIVYSGLMVIVSLAAIIRWDRPRRRLLFWCCLAAFAVGAAGFWLHSHGHPTQAIWRVLTAWFTDSRRHSNGHPDQALMHMLAAWYSNSPHRGPPALAPLSFAGLGLIGMLACAERLQAKEPP